MNLNLLTLSHQPLVWKDILPIAFKGIRLPGSTLLSASGDFGTVCIQEFHTDHYSIRLNVFDLLQKFIIKTVANETGIHTSLLLKGRSNNTMRGEETVLRQNQFSLFYAAHPEITTAYEKNLHISFDTLFSGKLIDELIPLFPSLSGLPAQPSITRPADAGSLDLVHSVLRCKYEEKFRHHFFDTRVRDLLFKYLVIAFTNHPAETEPSQNEIESVYKAEQIISTDIKEHIPIPLLSKKVLLNEFRLKQLFKKFFGTGPYEYLILKRLDKAKELLEQGLSVKEVAAQVGYRPSDFTTAFRRHFGYPPGILKKRNS